MKILDNHAYSRAISGPFDSFLLELDHLLYQSPLPPPAANAEPIWLLSNYAALSLSEYTGPRFPLTTTSSGLRRFQKCYRQIIGRSWLPAASMLLVLLLSMPLVPAPLNNPSFLQRVGTVEIVTITSFKK